MAGVLYQYGETSVPSGLSNVVALASKRNHSLALQTDGTVVGCGWNHFGETNVPVGLDHVLVIACGDFHGFDCQVQWSLGSLGAQRLRPNQRTAILEKLPRLPTAMPIVLP